MKKILNKQKGITLIALIITIIVMLILVAVTINFALNGGIFGKANHAKDLTQREVDKEELFSAVYGTLNKEGYLQLKTTEKLLENLSQGWQAETSSINTDYLEFTSPKDKVFYVNKETGEILDKLPAIETVSSEWWYNHGLTSSYVMYDVEYTADATKYSNGEDEGATVEFLSEGGLTFIEGEHNRNISLDIMNIFWDAGYWGTDAFSANDNWFCFHNASNNRCYTFYFTSDSVLDYISNSLATTDNINTITSGTLAGTLTVTQP